MNLWRPLLLLILSLAALSSARAQSVDGRFLVPLRDPATAWPHGMSALPSSTLDRLLDRYQPVPQNAADSRAQTFLSVDAGAGLSLLCDSAFGVNRVLADLEQHCLLGALDRSSLDRFGVTALGLQQNLRFGAEETPFDLSFGLSWLHADQATSFDGDALDWPLSADFELADAFAPVRGETLNLQATQWLSPRSWLRVTANTGRYRADRGLLLDPRTLRWNSSALSLQAGYGAFAGAVTGHRTDVISQRKSWFDIDLGVSWRTPWSGKVTVGARNLLNNAAEESPQTPPVSARSIDESRTPYVRYQQDL